MWIGYINIDEIVSACSKCLGVVQALFNRGRGAEHSLNNLGMSMNVSFHCSLKGLELMKRRNRHELTQSSNHR